MLVQGVGAYLGLRSSPPTIIDALFSFLHLADVHLDAALHGRSERVRRRLRWSLHRAFERAIDCAIEEQTDAVLIAGDLFDADRLSYSTEQFLLAQLYRLDEAGIACCYATGNHDAGGGTDIDWPDSLEYFGDREPRVVQVKDASGAVQCRVVGAGHVSPQVRENLAAMFPRADDGAPYVGLLHARAASAEGKEAHGRYAPCRPEDLRDSRYAYWALGHVHQHQHVDGAANAWYAGSLQGCAPWEVGAKGGLLVRLGSDLAPHVTFRPFAPVQWMELTLDGLKEVRTRRSLLQRIRRAFHESVDDAVGAEQWLLRIRLEGHSPLASELGDREAQAELEEAIMGMLNALDVELHTDDLTRPVDLAELREEAHVLGEVLRLIESAGTERKLLEDVAPEPLAREDLDPDERRSYLRSLLHGLDRKAAMRMLRERGTKGDG